MWKRIGTSSIGVVALMAIVTSSTPLGAAEPKVTDLLADTVEVYTTADATDVKTTLINSKGLDEFEILEIAENLMLRIKLKDGEGWVYPFMVETNFDPKDVGPCNYAFQAQTLGTRGIGDNCREPE